ncbi:GAF and ANTAR domain-containing protein [Mycolicibacterium sp. F2034L]|uniref:GAF and ANTAR domain-containing protein n=1 Tax=Mycolicibacterium sp. F2034L TaxID=2926422 RepID=UPI001FF139A7|nr:GAF and ANTAR domain-containing protein [Mycolicibacterium sp. F2034L]MCK0176932.1 GAF and ANTAR domain-containing protein [Mycolicibacterium sp. F2034L]
MPDNGHNEIVGQLTALVSDLERRQSRVQGGLAELVESATHHVPGAQYAGVTLASRSQGISTAAATGRYPTLLDEIQQRHQEGPCVSAAWEHHTVRIDDMYTEDRWPRYREDALKDTPIRAILAFEVFIDNDTLGALNLYSDRPRVFQQESIELGAVFATHIALAWSVFRRSDQFRSALASRDMIGQAKGIVMERFKVDSVRAFELLTRLSQESNTKLVDIAQQIIDTNRTDA